MVGARAARREAGTPCCAPCRENIATGCSRWLTVPRPSRALRSRRARHRRALWVRSLQRFCRGAGSALLLESFRPENPNPSLFHELPRRRRAWAGDGPVAHLSELRARFHGQDRRRVQGGATSRSVPSRREAAARRGRASLRAEAALRADRAAAEGLAGLTAWSFGACPSCSRSRSASGRSSAFPALHDDGVSVSLRPYDTRLRKLRVSIGLARLFALNSRSGEGHRTPAGHPRAGAAVHSLRHRGRAWAATGRRDPGPHLLGRAAARRRGPRFDSAVSEASRASPLIAQEFMRPRARVIAEHALLHKGLAASRPS